MTLKENISFTLIGGEKEIGANCYYLNFDGTGIILDSGLHPEKEGIDALPKLDLLQNLHSDYVFISHSHIDHIGSLPYLIQKFPHLKIYTTPQSRDIAEVMLHNSLTLTQKNVINSDPLPFYTHEQLDLLIETFHTIKYNDSLEIQGYRHHSAKPLQITMYDAGHILGSSGILLKSKNHKIFFTGDTCASKQSIMAGAEYPTEKVDLLILEATTAAAEDITTREKESKRFAKAINKTIDHGGSILIPVFALGKLQEMLSLLHSLMNKGSIPKLDIYTGGLGTEISSIYDLHRYNTKRNNNKLILSEIPQIPFNQEYLLDDKYFKIPSIVLASSGMVFENTTSFILAQRWLKHKNFGIFFVGYLDPDSPGYKILKSKKGDILKLTDTSEEIKVMCDIDYFRFSSHSNRNELLDLVKKLNPKHVILIHGEENGMNWIKTRIEETLPTTKVIIPEMGISYQII